MLPEKLPEDSQPGRYLRQARQRRGLTLDQVAAALDVGRNTYRALEVEDGRIPRPDVAGRLAAVLEIPQFELAAVLGYLSREDLTTLRQAADAAGGGSHAAA